MDASAWILGLSYRHRNREWEFGSKLGFIAGTGFKVNASGLNLFFLSQSCNPTLPEACVSNTRTSVSNL